MTSASPKDFSSSRFTVGCNGCEAKHRGSGVKPLSISCRIRLEETMRAAGRDEEVLNRRDARMRLREREQRHSHREGDGTLQKPLSAITSYRKG